MNTLDLEDLVAASLKEMYPEQDTVVPATPDLWTWTARRSRRRRTLVAAVGTAAAAAVIAAGVTLSVPRDNNDTSAPIASAAVPAWVAKCFRGTPDMSASDQAYLGLTRTQALDLAEQRDQQLVLVGAGGTCMSLGDDVARPNPVAVAFDTGSPEAGVPASGKVVFATSSRDVAYLGWSVRRG